MLHEKLELQLNRMDQQVTLFLSGKQKGKFTVERNALSYRSDHRRLERRHSATNGKIIIV